MYYTPEEQLVKEKQGFFNDLKSKKDFNEKIMCRFRNIEDLNEFGRINKLNIDKNTKTVNFTTMEIDGKGTRKVDFSSGMFDVEKQEKEWKKHWVGMPEFISNDDSAFALIEFHFDTFEQAKEVLKQDISRKTKSVWYPKLVFGKNANLRVVGGVREGKYPIYVVSKGRDKNCTTSRFLSQMEVHHYVVVEPDDVQKYKSYVENEYAKIIELDMSYKDKYDTFDELGNTKSKGPGAARNFCWEHSIKNGFAWHWVMDDNANEGFHIINRNIKRKCRTGAMFKACEDFVERYDNVAIAGLNYTKFAPENGAIPPYVTNTRIYSFLFIRNDIPYRWRGRYNEDTDLSLRVLKDGWCTIQFNAFLAGKCTTQKVKGGNTEVFYSKEGTYPKSKMLEDMHPDVAKVVWKFNRWHHYVNYSGYTQKLRYRDGFMPCKGVDNYGMVTIETEEKDTYDTRSYLENKYKAKIMEKMNEKR